jgi:hypothetical protein
MFFYIKIIYLDYRGKTGIVMKLWFKLENFGPYHIISSDFKLNHVGVASHDLGKYKEKILIQKNKIK